MLRYAPWSSGPPIGSVSNTCDIATTSPSSHDGEAQVALAVAEVAAQRDDDAVCATSGGRGGPARGADAHRRGLDLLGDGRAHLGDGDLDLLDAVELDHDVGHLRGQPLEQDVLRFASHSATRSQTRP